LSQAKRPLDAANFFLADVRDGLGPYLAIYLLTVQKWDAASIGVVMSIATVAGTSRRRPPAHSWMPPGPNASSWQVQRCW
jgi:hypothetical protein